MSNFNTAQTFKILGYANTFGDWVNTTNALVQQNNDLASNNFTKSSGTLFLSDPSLSLQVNNNSIFSGTLYSSGLGSAVEIQNNLSVGGQVYFTNAILGLTNYGQANINGPLLALSPSTGLFVSNTANIGGQLNVIKAATLSNTISVNSYGFFSNSITIKNTTYTNDLQANNNIGTSSLSIIYTGYSNILQANTSINTDTLTVTTKTYTNYLQANTSIATPSLNVTGKTNTDTLQANTSIYTPLLDLSVANITSGIIHTLSTDNLTVGTQGLHVLGNFTIDGTTIYNTPSFILSAGNPNPAVILNPGYGVYRNSSNAMIRWNETNLYWDMNDVVNGNYYRVLTNEYLSSSISSTSTSNVATSLAANTVHNNLITANTFLKANIISGIASSANYTNVANTFLQANDATTLHIATTYTDTANLYNSTYSSKLNAYSQSGYGRANTSVNSFTGTSGTATPPITGGTSTITMNSTNGVTVTGSGSTLTINTPQDLRTSATVQFGDINAIRNGSTTTGYLFLGNSGLRYLGYDGTNYQLPGTNLYTNGSLVLTAANYNSYAPTLNGTGAINGNWTINTTGTATNITAYPLNQSVSTSSSPTFAGVTTSASSGRVSLGTDSGGSVGIGLTTNNPTQKTPYIDFNSSATPVNYDVRLIASGNTSYVGGGTLSILANTVAISSTLTATSASISGTVTGDTFSGAGTSLTGLASSLTSGKASTLSNGGGTGTAMTFNWSGLTGQPTYLWGGNDGTNMYVYNPSNFNVNQATYLSASEQTNIITGKHASMKMLVSGSGGNIPDGSFVCRASGTGDANLAGVVYWNDAYAIKMGVRADGYFGLGGWSRTAWSWYSDASGNMVSAGNVTAYSDPRLKENIEKIESPIEKLSQLDGVYFNWKDGIAHTECKAGKRDLGVLANQVEEVFPEIVTDSIEIEGEKYKTVAYEKLVPVLIEAIKELSNEVKYLKEKIGE